MESMERREETISVKREKGKRVKKEEKEGGVLRWTKWFLILKFSKLI